MLDSKKILVLLIIGFMICSLFLPGSVDAEAEKPEWEVGDEWSMAYEKDLSELIAPALDEIINMTGQSQDIKDMGYDLDGEMAFYQIYKVTDETDDEYTMSIKAGGGVTFTGDFSMTGNFPEEGSYSNLDEPSTVEKTISAGGSLEMTLNIEGTAHFTRENLAMKDLSLNMSFVTKGDFEINNYPMIERLNETLEVQYKTYDGSVSGEVEADLDIEFSPALDLFDFPIEDGESWEIKSDATVSGSYRGRIEADGLPDELKEGLEEQNMSLPLEIEDLASDEEGFDDGTIEEHTEIFIMEAKCTGTEDMTLEDDTITEVYVIEMSEKDDSTEEYQRGYSEGYSDGVEDDSYDLDQYDTDPYSRGYQQGYQDGFFDNEYNETIPEYYGYSYQSDKLELMYSPEEGFIVSQRFSSSSRELSGIISSEDLTMKPTSEKSAEDNLRSLQANDEKEGGLLNKLTGPPYIFIMIFGAVTAIIAVILGMSTRGKKRKTRYDYQDVEQEEEEKERYQKEY